jgi:hypothetical protein
MASDLNSFSLNSSPNIPKKDPISRFQKADTLGKLQFQSKRLKIQPFQCKPSKIVATGEPTLLSGRKDENLNSKEDGEFFKVTAGHGQNDVGRSEGAEDDNEECDCEENGDKT